MSDNPITTSLMSGASAIAVAAASTTPTDLIVGASAIATALNCSVRHVYFLNEKGVLPVFKLPTGRTLYARKSTLESWLSAREAAALAERETA